jgi:NDP-sugar pyrophosphorylase family protein
MSQLNLSDLIVVVLAAGLGKRLNPLTQLLPKPAIPLLDQPLCLGMISQLLHAGAKTVHVNTSFLAEALEDQVMEALVPDQHSRIRFWRESPRLETGGALLNIFRGLAQEGVDPSQRDWLVVSGDILGLIPLPELLTSWERERTSAHALMACFPLNQDRTDVTWLSACGDRVIGFGSHAKPSAGHGGGAGHALSPQPALFSNFQMIKGTALADQAPCYGSSVELIYKPLINANKPVAALLLEPSLFWHNVGTPSEYLSSRAALLNLITHDPSSPICTTRNLIRKRRPAHLAPSTLVTVLNEVPKRHPDLSGDQEGKKEKGAPNTDAPRMIKGFVCTLEQAAGHCLIERPASLITACAADEGLECSLAIALEKILAFCKETEPMGHEASNGLEDFRPPVSVTLYLELPTTFPIQLPRPLFIGADLFVELALSQRGTTAKDLSPEPCTPADKPATGTWLGLLIGHLS